MKSVKTVEEYFTRETQWSEALHYFREIFQQTEMIETLKWGTPTYTIDGKNVAGMTSFKSHVAIWFHQGVFLKDEQSKLVNAQEGVTKALRQWRFTSVEEIKENKNLILNYLEEAIANQKLGKEIKPNFKKPIDIPTELNERMKSDRILKMAFEALTLGKKRDYTEYISTAKRLETKNSRLDKITPMILQGIGLNDKYK